MGLDPEQTRFKRLGQRLFGDDGWQSEFARMCGVSHQLVNKITNGDRKVTDVVHAKVIAGLRAEVERHRKRAINVLSLLREYEK
jgi:hypothetical protein